MPRYLFGPVTESYATEQLGGPIASGECVVFDLDGPLACHPSDSWESFSVRFPKNWYPDFLVLFLQYCCIPSWIWHAPIPIIGLATDWNLQWHHYRHVGRRCDHILTDTTGVSAFQNAGIHHVSAANLFGCDHRWVTDLPTAADRDIDILFIGNVHPFVQSDRLPWLARLAQLSNRYHIEIESGVFGDDYRNRLARSRIVFNRSIRGECNKRTFEAIAAGALLFQESENAEVRALLHDGKECVYYDDSNLEEQLEHYLSNESERAAIAECARRRLGHFTFEHLWGEQVASLDSIQVNLTEPMQARLADARSVDLMGRVWQRQIAAFGGDPALAANLNEAIKRDPGNAMLHHALGCVAFWDNQLERAVKHFQIAFGCDPRHVVAGVSLIQGLIRLGQNENAINQARRVLQMLSLNSSDHCHVVDAPVAQIEYSPLRVAWEKAAFDNSGNPNAESRSKHLLLVWQTHSLLGDLTGDAFHYYEALRARPDMLITHGSLGSRLRQCGKPQLALNHLRIAADAFPFDSRHVGELYKAMGEVGDLLGQHRLAIERTRLHSAAPKLVPLEDWFSDSVPVSSAKSVNTSRKFRIAWHGDQSTLHSFSIVNREICTRLIERGHEVTLIESCSGRLVSSVCPLPALLARRLNVSLSGPPDVHICHRWPPILTAPTGGHWVWIQPWEYGSLPLEWIPTITELLDEIWVPTHHVRRCFAASGIPSSRVAVIPNGVADVFFGSKVLFPLKTRKRFRFLFVGGTIHRKGFDLLLDAFGRTFRRTDDVCLVLKDMGTRTFYAGRTAEAQIAEFRSQPDAPEVEYFDDELTPAEMAGLYANCHCLVHPYRAEGFGMPIAEAMASGLPVIVTGAGAALDFCSDDNAFLVPARRVEESENRLDNLVTFVRPHWAEVDPDQLRYFLRHVFDNQSEANRRAKRGATLIRERFNWDRVVDLIELRLEQLAECPVRRLTYHRAGQVSITTTMRPPSTRASHANQRLSLCMIVRDNEDTIEACLASIQPWVDEMIVVDTGSTDRTVEICRRFGAQVHFFPWCDDFSAARNESLKHATGDWIFWMDSDDIMPADQGPKLRELTDRDHHERCLGYVLQVHCPSRQAGQKTVVDHVKLFRRLPSLRFEHRIHEQILPSIRRAGGLVEFTQIFVVHAGSNQTAEGRTRKLERDIRILDRELLERPEHPFVLFNLGMTYADAEMFVEAAAYLRRGINVACPHESQLPKAWALLVNCHRSLGQIEEASNAVDHALQLFPNDKELLFRRGTLFQDSASHEEAIRVYHRILTEGSERVFMSVDPAICGFKAHHNLAFSLKELGRLKEAADHWQQTVRLAPEFPEAWLALARVLVQTKDVGTLESVIRILPDNIRNSADGAMIRALLAEAQGQLIEAQRILETAWTEFQDPDCLDELSRILCEHDMWTSAIPFLEELNRRRPDNASVLHNLGSACLQSGESATSICFLQRSLQLRPTAEHTRRLLTLALERSGESM